MKVFFNAICQMGIFMVCAQAIVHFRPNGSYEKYLRMLVSVMILVQIFLPVTRLFSGGVQQNMDELVNRMQRQMEESMEQAKSFSAASDELLDRMTLEEVKTRLNNLGETEPETQEAGTQTQEAGTQEPEIADTGASEAGAQELRAPEADASKQGPQELGPQQPQRSEAAGRLPENGQEPATSGIGAEEISVEPIKIEIGGE